MLWNTGQTGAEDPGSLFSVDQRVIGISDKVNAIFMNEAKKADLSPLTSTCSSVGSVNKNVLVLNMPMCNVYSHSLVLGLSCRTVDLVLTVHT